MITSSVGTILDMCDRPLNDESIPSILEQLADLGKQIPLAADRWRVSLLLKIIADPVNAALKERNNLFQKYGHLENNRWLMEPVKLPNYKRELADLRSEKVELNVSPLPMEIFNSSEVTVANLLMLVEGGIVSPPKEP